MNNINKTLSGITVVVLILFGFRALSNQVDFEMKKYDETTRYSNIKKVEDECRSLISNYKNDRLIWEQNKDSKDPYNKSLAGGAKMRANRTAIQYNEYILKNSFLWKENIPQDIKEKLEIIGE